MENWDDWDDIIKHTISFNNPCRSIEVLYAHLNISTEEEAILFAQKFVDEWHEIYSKYDIRSLAHLLRTSWTENAGQIATAIWNRIPDMFIDTIKSIVSDQLLYEDMNIDISDSTLMDQLDNLAHLYWLLWNEIENKFDREPREHNIDQHLLDTINRIAQEIVTEDYIGYQPMLPIIIENMKYVATQLQWMESNVIYHILNNYRSYQLMWGDDGNDLEQFNRLKDLVNNMEVPILE